MKKNYIILISIQIIMILFLGVSIYKKRASILGTTNITTINKKYIDVINNSSFKYFYEPKANTLVDKLNDGTSFKAVYSINSDALNERFEYEIKKSPRTFRIITLGDSFTYGVYVDTQYNWPEQLEDILNNSKCSQFDKFEVINLGVYGYDIQYSAERFKLRGKKYSPDLVIWFMKSDDYEQINEIMLSKEQYYSKKLRETGEFDKLVTQGQLYPSWNMAMKETQEELGKETIILLQQQYLDEFSELYKNPLVLMNFKNEPKEVKDFYINYSKKRKNTYVFNNLVDIYKNSEYFFPNDGHPTDSGHKVIAEDVYNYLTENNIIPCN